MDPFRQQGLVVDDDAVVDDLHAEARQHGLQHGTVDVPDLAGAGDSFRRHQLVAGGDDAHGQLFDHGDPDPADGGQCADVLAGQHPALLQDHLAGVHIVPTEDHILSRRGGLADADGAVAVVLGVFDHDHAVGPLRNGTAGGDRHAFLGVQLEFRALAHEDLALEWQDGRDGVGAAEGIPGPDGVAVHGGPVKVRDIFLRGDILGQYPAQGGIQPHLLRLTHKVKFFFDQSQNFLRRFYMQHIRPP